MTRISVVMPVYNTEEEYLREAIESILNQTYTDFEFLIINDGSKNNAEEVILSYKDERIKYIKQENQGVPKTLNNGFNLAVGEFIARMDADDISLPTRFEKQVKFLDENKNISLVGTSFETFPKKQIMISHKYPKILDFLKGCMVGHPTVMLRKADFDKYNLRYNENFKVAQDYELWSRAIRVLNFANIQEILFKYRIHENNNSRPSETLAKNNIYIKNSILAFLTEDPLLQEKVKNLLLPDVVLEIVQPPSFLQKLFSIREEYSKNKKYLVLRILGIKISIKKEKN